MIVNPWLDFHHRRWYFLNCADLYMNFLNIENTTINPSVFHPPVTISYNPFFKKFHFKIEITQDKREKLKPKRTLSILRNSLFVDKCCYFLTNLISSRLSNVSSMQQLVSPPRGFCSYMNIVICVILQLLIYWKELVQVLPTNTST